MKEGAALSMFGSRSMFALAAANALLFGALALGGHIALSRSAGTEAELLKLNESVLTSLQEAQSLHVRATVAQTYSNPQLRQEFKDGLDQWQKNSDSLIGALLSQPAGAQSTLNSFYTAQGRLAGDWKAMLQRQSNQDGSEAVDQTAFINLGMKASRELLGQGEDPRFPWLWSVTAALLMLLDGLVLRKILTRPHSSGPSQFQTQSDDEAPQLRQALAANESALKASEQQRAMLKQHSIAMEIELEKAVEANRLKGGFLANMSHEIRTPMTGVIGMAEMLSNTQLTPDQEECVSSMIDSGRHLLRIVNDILDLSQVEAGKLQLELEPVKMQDVVKEAVRPFANGLRAKGVDLHVRVDAGHDELPLLDPGRIRQILSNLLNNADRFTSSGSIEVEVEVVKVGFKRAQVSISVRDTGAGIPKDRIDAIFESFTQADAGTRKAYGGTGLGLTIVKQLAELMQGTVSVQSTQGVGSEFTVRIPVDLQENEDEGGPRREERPAEVSRNYGYHILVAEDIPINRTIIGNMLGILGCTVEFAEDGAIALEKTLGSSYDVILMDIHMPSVDGIEATAEIRRREKSWNRRRTPIVACTADVMEEDRKKFREVGMDGLVPKPVIMAGLASALDQLKIAKAA